MVCTLQVISEEDIFSVTNLDTIWLYISDVLVSGLYDKEEPEFVNDLASLRLSPPLLVQKRKEGKFARLSSLHHVYLS